MVSIDFNAKISSLAHGASAGAKTTTTAPARGGVRASIANQVRSKRYADSSEYSMRIYVKAVSGERSEGLRVVLDALTSAIERRQDGGSASV
jgi:hypothetical protein